MALEDITQKELESQTYFLKKNIKYGIIGGLGTIIGSIATYYLLSKDEPNFGLGLILGSISILDGLLTIAYAREIIKGYKKIRNRFN
ncbi:MAG: hypothetical protein AB1571_04060 [Nanoarchaeota archaeon]